MKDTPPWYEVGATLPLPVYGQYGLLAQTEADQRGVTIRLTDDRDAAFWADIRLTEGDLVHLLEQVQQSPCPAA